MVIESLLVIPVAPLYLAIVPGRGWTECLMLDMQSMAQRIERMNTLCLGCMRKLSTIVCLDPIRGIAKIRNCALHKIYRAIAIIFLVGVDKTLSGCLFDPRVRVEFFIVRACIANNWHIFHIHLPLLLQFGWRIVVA